ncbi:MAG: hypothetical protein P8X64_06585 [Anaerolineales bacterium]
MIPLTFNDVQMLLSAALFVLGFLLVLIGSFVMVNRGYSREISALAKHTARHSANELVASITSLVRTASGIGVFLIMLGLGMLGASYWVLQQVQWPL